MESLLKRTNYRLLQFTGSSGIADRLCNVMHGKIKIEDAGFDWKILGPDVLEFDYVCY
jgi:1-pyrroline-5-carboxylate dehydrogenase